ncbi:MAG TPA: fatty acid desaturase [Cyclobacteriaceae bacterium]|nr:fatty acid desaturase [Cyclobacteriaceae bacterium]
MKDRHIKIQKDAELLKLIYKEVDTTLVRNPQSFVTKLVIKFVVYFSAVVITYSLLFIVNSASVFVACFVLYGIILLLFAFNFSHDFSHNTIFKNARLNNACFTLIYSMTGAHAESWKHRHINSHHFAPNVEHYDTDLNITNIIRVVPGSEHKWYHRFQHYYATFAYTTYSLFWVFIKDFVVLFSDDNPLRKKLHYHIVFWSQKLFYVSMMIILPIAYSNQAWQIVVIGFLCMHLAQSLFLLYTFFMTHHVESTVYPETDNNGYINTSWFMNQVRSSNDMHPFSEVANFIFGGFNNHIAHHLFPHYHHIYYPKLNKILYGILIENGITPNQTTYWGGVISHLRLLKRMSLQ